MKSTIHGEFELSNAWLNNVPVLRDRLKEQGYLFFREVLDKAALQQIRRDILETATKYGIVDLNHPLMDGLFSGNDFPTAVKFETSKLYREILDIPSFNTFGQDPLLSLLFSGLLDAEILEHRRRIGRITFPQSFANTTPPHQDFFYIGGTEDTYTCWIPTDDCPQPLGGLAILESSNKLGMLTHTGMSGTGGHGIEFDICDATGLRWLSTDFKQGDLLLFHSHTIHKALDNTTANQLRVSLEYRIQRKREKISPSSMEYHMKGAFDE